MIQEAACNIFGLASEEAKLVKALSLPPSPPRQRATAEQDDQVNLDVPNNQSGNPLMLRFK